MIASSAVHSQATRRAEPRAIGFSNYVTGLTLTAAVPAAFWTLMIAAVSNFFGASASPSALTAIAVSIAVFLGLVFSALNARAN